MIDPIQAAQPGSNVPSNCHDAEKLSNAPPTTTDVKRQR